MSLKITLVLIPEGGNSSVTAVQSLFSVSQLVQRLVQPGQGQREATLEIINDRKRFSVNVVNVSTEGKNDFPHKVFIFSECKTYAEDVTRGQCWSEGGSQEQTDNDLATNSRGWLIILKHHNF